MTQAETTGSVDERAERPERLPSGELVGDKYRIDDVIGEGGMGRVYAATHVVTGKAVALKCLLPRESEDPRAAIRFLREARAAGAIDHPNVVTVFDAGRHGDTPFLVMELLRGRPLRSLVGEAPLPPSELLPVLMPALRGIHAAHERGIVHRDLKPENIFLCEDTGGWRDTKVLDFGIAKAFDGRLHLHTATRSGAVVGTPHYMSPEQVRGVSDVDARSDVYAIGVILYEALTGRYPFTAPTFTALAIEIATGDLAPPSAHAPGLDRDPEAIVLRALARDPADRYPDVASLGRALEPFSGGVRFDARGDAVETKLADDRERAAMGAASTQQAPTPLPASGEIPPARVPTAWIAAGLIAVAGAVAIAVLAWPDAPPAAPPPRASATPFVQVHEPPPEPTPRRVIEPPTASAEPPIGVDPPEAPPTPAAEDAPEAPVAPASRPRAPRAPAEPTEPAAPEPTPERRTDVRFDPGEF